MDKNLSAVALGRLGGKSRSEAKVNAARENGKKGGRPRTRPKIVEVAPELPAQSPSKPKKPAPVIKSKAFITSKKGFCYLTIKIGRMNFNIMKIRKYTISSEDKRDMRRLHKDVEFDWKKIAKQLAEKREVCRDYRSRRQRPRRRREPFHAVYDPLSRTVYSNGLPSIGGAGAMLDMILAHDRAHGRGIFGNKTDPNE